MWMAGVRALGPPLVWNGLTVAAYPFPKRHALALLFNQWKPRPRKVTQLIQGHTAKEVSSGSLSESHEAPQSMASAGKADVYVVREELS